MMIVSIGFAYSLIPQIILNHKNKKVFISNQTIFITTIGIIIACICYVTLNMFLTTIINAIVGSCWIYIGIQKLIYKK